jgi:hypothetical protein
MYPESEQNEQTPVNQNRKKWNATAPITIPKAPPWCAFCVRISCLFDNYKSFNNFYFNVVMFTDAVYVPINGVWIGEPIY